MLLFLVLVQNVLAIRGKENRKRRGSASAFLFCNQALARLANIYAPASASERTQPHYFLDVMGLSDTTISKMLSLGY
jgi:hypothetical protein